MTALLVVALLVVLAHQAVGALRPRAECPARSRMLSGWHAGMALGMVAMLALPLRSAVAGLLVGVFAVGTGWAVRTAWTRRAEGDGQGPLHTRLGVACAAMVAMLWPALSTPAAAASTASTPSSTVLAGSVHHAAVTLPGGHDHTAALEPGSPLLWLSAALLLAVAVVAVLAARRTLVTAAAARAAETRGDACCESVMALAAGWMLAVPVLGALGA
ncbi:DUF5134 domain-containing protein [Phycicoccus sp. CSK15P-2]|uniref:DUF5134 domain-containing protein n=1 Tax=Phycicoccus sp. CSK15P-2 TaxID=2807627 RepID=UPI00194FF3AD|nr:DUF5134 domain-containing protein [Phycicoccus sp. CSK15P-2]MBM6403544.1 DUF5134 domain-containing protein [Phycicoccus sp. CSK15P-2]